MDVVGLAPLALESVAAPASHQAGLVAVEVGAELVVLLALDLDRQATQRQEKINIERYTTARQMDLFMDAVHRKQICKNATSPLMQCGALTLSISLVCAEVEAVAATVETQDAHAVSSRVG